MTLLTTVTHANDPVDVHLLRLLALIGAALLACFSNTAVVYMVDATKRSGVQPLANLQAREVGRRGEGRGGEGRRGEGRGGERRRGEERGGEGMVHLYALALFVVGSNLLSLVQLL